MKYQPGDRVRVRNDIKADTEYQSECGESVYCNDDMARRRGQLVTIKFIDTWESKMPSVYHIDDDDGEFGWAAEMFESSQMFDENCETTGELIASFDALMR